MEENGTKKPSVRKLTVDNFSVIKHAELEFGKITVLIGPQASGKSLLCKLAFFLSKRTLDLAVAAVLGRHGYEGFKKELNKELFARFPIDSWQSDSAKFTFQSLEYSISVFPRLKPGEIEVNIEFSSRFEILFESLTAQMAYLSVTSAESRLFLAEQFRTQFELLLNQDNTEDVVYFPSGRAFFVNQSMGFQTLSNPSIDPILRDFSLELRLSDSWEPNPIAGEHVLRAIEEIRREMLRIAGGFVKGRDASLRFKRASDEKEIPLGFLSSGTQELLPLFNVLSQMAARQRDRIVFPGPDNLPGLPNRIIVSKGSVYVEEPEASVFPSTQSDLVRLFSRISSTPRLEFSFVITTHSPYLLTSFNELISAGKAAKAHPERRDEIEKVIPKECWIGEGDLTAYGFDGKDGILHPMMDQETGLINGDVLDSVSDRIGGRFEQLLDLEYGD